MRNNKSWNRKRHEEWTWFAVPSGIEILYFHLTENYKPYPLSSILSFATCLTQAILLTRNPSGHRNLSSCLSV